MSTVLELDKSERKEKKGKEEKWVMRQLNFNTDSEIHPKSFIYLFLFTF